MTGREPAAAVRIVRGHPLLAFYGLALGFSWLVWLPLWWPASGIEGSSISPLRQGLGAHGPLVAAFLVTALDSGWRGCGDLARRCLPAKGSGFWLLVGFVGPLAMLCGARALAGWIGASETAPPAPGFPDLAAPAYYLFALATYALGEETGWRGYALARLQSRHSAVVSTLLLSLAWALWHLPLLVRGPTGAVDLLGWFGSLLAGSFVLTWLYNESCGSLLAVTLFHAGVDLAFQSRPTSRFALGAMVALIVLWAAAVLLWTRPALARGGRVVLEAGRAVVLRR